MRELSNALRKSMFKNVQVSNPSEELVILCLNYLLVISDNHSNYLQVISHSWTSFDHNSPRSYTLQVKSKLSSLAQKKLGKRSPSRNLRPMSNHSATRTINCTTQRLHSNHNVANQTYPSILR